MKRIHIHIAVNDLAKNIDFYSALFDAQPTVLQQDYAKWTVEEPAVNLSISNRAGVHQIDHLGIQVDDDTALSDIDDRMQKNDTLIDQQRDAQCCYAKSNKTWVEDPQGIAWELFHTYGSSESFGESHLISGDQTANACGSTKMSDDNQNTNTRCC